MMRLTVEITAPKREKATGAREAQARLAEFAAALRLVSDRIANAGAPEGEQGFEFGALRGSYSIAGAST
jgi:hypothetical protein